MEQLKNSELQHWSATNGESILQTTIRFYDEKTKLLENFQQNVIQLLNEITAVVKAPTATKADILKASKNYNNQLLALINDFHNDLMQTSHAALGDQLRETINNTEAAVSVISSKEMLQQLPMSGSANPALFASILRHNLQFFMLRMKHRLLFFKPKKNKASEDDMAIELSRNIPFSDMLHKAFEQDFKNLALILTLDFLEKTAAFIAQLWDFDNQFDDLIIATILLQKDKDQLIEQMQTSFEQLEAKLNAEINQLRESLGQKCETLLNQHMQSLDQAIQIIDTPLLPLKHFEQRQHLFADTPSDERVQKQEHEWLNTIQSITDDWTSDIRFGLLFYDVYQSFSDGIQLLNERFFVPIKEVFSSIIDLLNEQQVKINKDTSDVADQLLLEIQDVISQKIRNHLLEKAQKMLADKEQFHFKLLLDICAGNIDKLREKQRYFANKKQLQPLSDGAVQWVVPADLLTYNAIPVLEKAIESFFSETQKTLEFTSRQLDKSVEVVLFNIETAYMMHAEGKANSQQALQMASEGFTRTLSHLETAITTIRTLHDEGLKAPEQAIHRFNNNIHKLRDSATLSQLNLQIARARTIEHSKQLRAQTWFNLKEQSKALYSHANELINQATSYVFKVQVQLGIQTEKKAVGYYLSGFIRKAEHKLESLPFVYQRLFQFSKPIEDRFFIGRTKELEELEKAYQLWHEGGFVLSALLGEKGSGKSALLKQFQKKVGHELKIIEIELDEKITDTSTLCGWLSQQLLNRQCNDFEQLAEQLMAQQEKQMIILNNMQHMFLKRVGGFNAHQRMLDLLYLTARQHFWLVTYTPVSFSFLNHAQHIADSYTQIVRLEKPGQQMLEQIILSRHNLSGFRLNFITNTDSKPILDQYNPKRLLKSEEAQSTFFKELLQQTNGNIRLAMMYWLHHIEMSSNNTMDVSALVETRMEYIRELSADNLFNLHLILLHDGLGEPDFTLLSGKTRHESITILLSLKEKGLLLHFNNKYTINPVVYPFLTNVLQSRNLIY